VNFDILSKEVSYKIIVDTPTREIVCVKSSSARSVPHGVSVKNVISDSRIGKRVDYQARIEPSSPSTNDSHFDWAVPGYRFARLRKPAPPRAMRAVKLLVMCFDNQFGILVSDTRHC
jgi:hypothetical protein